MKLRRAWRHVSLIGVPGLTHAGRSVAQIAGILFYNFFAKYICSLSLSFKARWTHPDNVDNDDVVNQCLKFADNSGSLVANVLRAAATVSIATKLASPWKMLKL